MSINKYVMVPVGKYEQLVQAKEGHQNNEHNETISIQPTYNQSNDVIDSHKMDEVIRLLPRNIKHNGGIILTYMNKDPDINWDKDLQLVVKGNIIKGSNLIDLIKSTQYLYKTFIPLGAKDFNKALSKYNLPQTCIKIKNNRSEKQITTKKWIHI